jgi:hypothetical protein
MKRTVILLTLLGLILLVGGRENSLAQNVSSVLPEYTQSDDSSTAASLQERADKNFKYIKADPVGPGKVAGELLAGSIGSVMGGSICARIGFGIGSEGGGGGFCSFDEGGLIGALVGYAIGSNLGSATGVCLVGNSGGESGSFWAAFGGSLLGMLGGGLLSVAILRSSDNEESSLAAFFLLTGAQAGVATLCFNATRKKKVEGFSNAMFNLEDGKLALAMPQVNISQDSSKSGVYKVNIFKTSF